MALVFRDKIEVKARRGTCQIELLYGSATSLGKGNAVDVLVVSAFPGSYATVHETVIGALDRDLGLSVMHLSNDKEEDLRQFFSCWWSKPLPDCEKYGFERIMCFEGGYKRDSKPPMVISEVFRSLVSLCKNKDISVAMPLLASGRQKYSEKLMLGLIVDAAIHWIQVGLPLTTLKIVVYRTKPEQISTTDDPLLQHFQNIKAKQLEKERVAISNVSIKYDVYLSYSLTEEVVATKICKMLQEQKENVRIFSEKQIINEDESWQDDIYQVMSSCSRVVALLTPSFLQDPSCVEQYNIALCCTRTMKRDFLAPLYLQDIEHLPTYIGLIQYIDCRPMDPTKIFDACNRLCTRLISVAPQNPNVLHVEMVNKTAEQATSHMLFEVFISYSRANSDIALRVKDWILASCPDWRIFIDISVLEAGSAWQSTLYNSLEHSRIILPLLSPAFLESKVCQEEFNLSSLLHVDPCYMTQTVPLIIDKIPKLPLWTQSVPICNLRMDEDSFVEKLISILKSHMKGSGTQCIDLPTQSSFTGQDGKIENFTDANSLLSAWRTHNFLANLPFFSEVRLDLSVALQITTIAHVFVSHHENDEEHANILRLELRKYVPNIEFTDGNGDNRRSEMLDKADLIVPLISADYMKTDALLEELHIGMCKLRFSEKLLLVPILLEPARASPAFLRILNVLFACQDYYWDLKHFWGGHQSKIDRGTLCLQRAALFMAQILENPARLTGPFKLLLSIAEVRLALHVLKWGKGKNEVINPFGPSLPQTIELQMEAEETGYETSKCHCLLL